MSVLQTYLQTYLYRNPELSDANKLWAGSFPKQSVRLWNGNNPACGLLEKKKLKYRVWLDTSLEDTYAHLYWAVEGSHSFHVSSQRTVINHYTDPECISWFHYISCRPTEGTTGSRANLNLEGSAPRLQKSIRLFFRTSFNPIAPYSLIYFTTWLFWHLCIV